MRKRIQFKLTDSIWYELGDNYGDIINESLKKFYYVCRINGFSLGFLDYIRTEYVHHHMEMSKQIPSKYNTRWCTIDLEQYDSMKILKSEYKKYSVRIIEFSLFYYFYILPECDRTY